MIQVVVVVGVLGGRSGGMRKRRRGGENRGEDGRGAEGVGSREGAAATEAVGAGENGGQGADGWYVQHLHLCYVRITSS